MTMRTKVGAWLRTPRGCGVTTCFGLCAVFGVTCLVFNLPSRWVPDAWPWLLNFVIGLIFGYPLGWLAGAIGNEVTRFVSTQRAFAEVQRDIERLERGDR